MRHLEQQEPIKSGEPDCGDRKRQIVKKCAIIFCDRKRFFEDTSSLFWHIHRKYPVVLTFLCIELWQLDRIRSILAKAYFFANCRKSLTEKKHFRRSNIDSWALFFCRGPLKHICKKILENVGEKNSFVSGNSWQERHFWRPFFAKSVEYNVLFWEFRGPDCQNCRREIKTGIFWNAVRKRLGKLRKLKFQSRFRASFSVGRKNLFLQGQGSHTSVSKRGHSIQKIWNVVATLMPWRPEQESKVSNEKLEHWEKILRAPKDSQKCLPSIESSRVGAATLFSYCLVIKLSEGQKVENGREGRTFKIRRLTFPSDIGRFKKRDAAQFELTSIREVPGWVAELWLIFIPRAKSKSSSCPTLFEVDLPVSARLDFTRAEAEGPDQKAKWRQKDKKRLFSVF